MTDREMVAALLLRAADFRALMRLHGVGEDRLTFCITAAVMGALSRFALKIRIAPISDDVQIDEAGSILGMTLTVQPSG